MHDPMHASAVFFQITLLTESSIANLANVRPLIGMSAPMSNDASFAAKTLVADVAGVWLSIGVPGQVFF